MAFVRPTLAELVERIQQDLVSRLGGRGPLLRRSMVYVVARIVAGAAHMLHGHLEYLARQVFPDQSERDFLLRQAAQFGLALKAAGYATGNVSVTGTTGIVVPAGTALLRSSGARYATNAEVTLASGTALAAVTAEEAGEAGNADPATALSFESPLSGVSSSAAVDSGGITNGSDEESIDSLRARLLERLQYPPHGGSASDYVAWAKAVAGVTRAWCYPLENGPGTVVVRFVRDDDTSIIPDSGEVAVVQAYIDARHPVTADVTVEAPTAVPLDFTLHIVPDTTATREAVRAELEDLILRAAQPGATILRSQIEIAAGTAAGVTNFTVTLPAADVTHATGEMATFGAITWA